MAENTGSIALTTAAGSFDRSALMDLGWPVAFVVLAAGIWTPWYLGVLSIDLSHLLWWIFLFGILHEAAGRLFKLCKKERSILLAHSALNLLATAFLGFIWTKLGGLASPYYSLIMVLPIIAVGPISHIWMPYGIAVWAVLVSWIVGITTSVELRWHLEQLGIPPIWRPISDMMPDLSGIDTIGPGFALQYMLVLSLLLLASAVLTGSVASLIERLNNRIRTISAAASREKALAERIQQEYRRKEAVVNASTREIISITPHLLNELGLEASQIVGQRYSNHIGIAGPEPLDKMISEGREGQLRHMTVVAADDTRLVNIAVRSFDINGTPAVGISLQDLSDEHYVNMAIEALQENLGVIDADGTILFSSPSLRQLFPAFIAGESADNAPLPADWWRIAPRRRHCRILEMNGENVILDLSRIEYFASALSVTVFKLRRQESPA